MARAAVPSHLRLIPERTPWAANIADWAHDDLPAQDGYAIDPDAGAAAVMDGLAGHAGAEHAVALAARIVADRFAALADDPDDWAVRTFDACRDELLAARAADSDLAEMTCAIIVGSVADGQLNVAWAGDCRAYRIRGRDRWVTRLTDDHNLVYEAMIRGRVSQHRADAIHRALEDVQTLSEAWRAGGGLAKKALKRGHLVVSELSGGPVGVLRDSWDPQDTLVMVTDGVTANITGTRLRELLAETAPQDTAEAVVAEAHVNARAGLGRCHPDDITCAVLGPR